MYIYYIYNCSCHHINIIILCRLVIYYYVSYICDFFVMLFIVQLRALRRVFITLFVFTKLMHYVIKTHHHHHTYLLDNI